MFYGILGFATAAIVYRAADPYSGEDARSWGIVGFIAPLVAGVFGGRFASDLLIMSGRIPTDDGPSTIVHVAAFVALAAVTAALAVAPRFIGIGERVQAPAGAERRTATMEPRTITSGG